MFLMRHAGSWGLPMSHIRHYLSILAARIEGREGGERLCYVLSSDDGGVPLGGKRRLIQGGGSTAQVSNGTRPQNSDDGGGFCLSDSWQLDVPRGIIQPSAEVVVAMAVADVVHARLDCPESLVPDRCQNRI